MINQRIETLSCRRGARLTTSSSGVSSPRFGRDTSKVWPEMRANAKPDENVVSFRACDFIRTIAFAGKPEEAEA